MDEQNEKLNPVILAADNVTKDFKIAHAAVSSLKEYITHPSTMINKSYDNFRVLDDVSVEIREGDFFGIVGRNGSGKSTLLKILAGIYKPSDGAIRTRGKVVPFIELGVGFNNELSGRDNVYLNGAMLGFTRQEVADIYDEIVGFAELEDFMEQKLKNFSSGMRVRLAFSIAIKAEADVLLIDEVLAVGDAAFKKKCFDYFKSLIASDKTVVFVSHSMNAVRDHCNKGVLIEGGKILKAGSADDIADAYEQLFAKKDSKAEAVKRKQASQKMRSGSREVEIMKVSMPSRVTRDDKEVVVDVELVANEDVKSPIFGFSVKDEASRHLLGTNTHLKSIKTPDLKAGDKVSLEWRFANVLRAGTHYLNIAVVDDSGKEQYDVMKEAHAFDSVVDEKTPFPVMPDIKFDLKKSAKN